jgi:ABC-type sugar transport system permease subunit
MGKQVSNVMGRWSPVVIALAWLGVGAEIGWLANSRGWFLGGVLWPLGGAALGAVALALPWVRRPVHRFVERRWRELLPHAAWIQVALLGLILSAEVDVKLLDMVGTVTVVGALVVGYFVEANLLVEVAPRHRTLFGLVAGAAVGALAGVVLLVVAAGVAALVDDADGGAPGGPGTWAMVGAVVGALVGGLVWARRPGAERWVRRIPERGRPVVFLGPPLLFVAGALVIPTLRTIYLSFRVDDPATRERDLDLVGTENYRRIVTDDTIFNLDGIGDVLTSRLFVAGVAIGALAMVWVVLRGLTTRRGVDLSAPLPVISLTTTAMLVVLAMMGTLTGVVWNNFFWIVLATGFSTVIGLAIAVLADRSKGETVAKSLIFMPMAISFVGASVIWRFVYAFSQTNEPFSLLNAIWVGLGGEQQIFERTPPWNDLFLIVIMIWIQTGFAMVVFSAAIKNVPTELHEAARVDGANEGQAFWRITVPHIRSTIGVVVTTLIVTVLKIYDIVRVMTNGDGDTDVIANRMYREAFLVRNRGLGSALAVVLFVTVLPLMVVNVRRLRRAEEEAR